MNSPSENNLPRPEANEFTRVTFTLTRRDVVGFSLRHQLRQRSFYFLLTLPLLCGGLVVLANVGNRSWAQMQFDFAVVAGIGTLGMAVFMGFVFALIAWRIYRLQDPSLFSPQTLILLDRGFRNETIQGFSETLWSFVRLKRTPDCLYLYTRPLMAYLVPRRAFATEHEWDSFCGYCRSRCAAP